MTPLLTPIGRVKGPGSTPHSFTFLAPDTDQTLKVGEFILYQTFLEGVERPIFARITFRQPVRLFPDSFAVDPSVDPAFIAELVGYTDRHDLFELTATIVGYYDAALTDFVNPRIPPPMGQALYQADHDTLQRVLNRYQPGMVGAVHVGSLLSRGVDDVPVVLDAASFASTHLAIIASTGAGKSYLAAVILEELLMPNNRAAVLVIDPHGEYHTLSHMNQHPMFRQGAYAPQVALYQPGTLKVRPASLTLADLKYLLPDLSERMEYLLSRAYYDVRQQSKSQQGHPERWTRGDLLRRLNEMAEGKGDGLKGYGSTAEALTWRLNSVLGCSLLFADHEDVPLTQLCQPGQCSVLQLHETGQKEQQVLVSALLRKLLQARIQTEKKQVKPGHELYLPYPVFVLIEEAHRFAPHAGDAVSTGVLREILSEGRKFGVGIGVVSQRPGKLDADVLSQCNTHCLMRIVNPLDQNRVAESIESVGRELAQELPALTKGQVIVAGQAVNTPVLVRVRSRLTPHGAETLDAPQQWLEYSQETLR
jgi:DNA helicase HerA-like ATPase